MNSITVRKARADDASGLSELFVDFIGKPSHVSAMEKQIERLSIHPNYYTAVACDRDHVIGTAMGIVCYDLVGDCNPFMLIENVVVSPDYFRRGVGTLLMEALERFGINNGCKYVILVSEIQREPSHQFYESIGYSSDQRGFKKRLIKDV